MGSGMVMQKMTFLLFRSSSVQMFPQYLWKTSSRSEYIATPDTSASTIFYFLNFQNYREHVYNNLWKFHRNRMNGVCSCRATPSTPASTYFIYFLKFPKSSLACLLQLCWKFHRNRMNVVCSCRERATPCTPASTVFTFLKFPKPPRACLQQLVKVSSQSGKRPVLLYWTHL